jgi:hypothetical protein
MRARQTARKVYTSIISARAYREGKDKGNLSVGTAKSHARSSVNTWKHCEKFSVPGASKEKSATVSQRGSQSASRHACDQMVPTLAWGALATEQSGEREI